MQIGAVRLRNPILAASGTFGYGVEFAHLVDLNCLGGLVTKGLSREPMEGAPAPRLCETPSGMLNAVGLQNIGVRAFVAEKLPVLRKYDTAVIANVFGYSIEDYVEVIRVLEDADGLAAYELNISCPNVKKGGMQFGNDPAQVAEVVGAARKAAAKTPALGKALADGCGYWTYCSGCGGSRCRCPDSSEHLSGNGGRSVDWQVLPGKPNGGPFGPVY